MSHTAVRLSPPPAIMLKIGNPVFRAVLKSPLGRRVATMGVLSFTGRRSGRHIEIPVGIHEIGGVPTVFTDRTWRLNFTGGAPVTVTYRGHTYQATGTLADAGATEVGVAMRTALDAVGNPRRLGVVVERGHEVSAADLAGLGQSMIRLDLTNRAG